MRLVKVRQHFEAPMVSDLDARVREEVRRLLQKSALERGSRVAITAGSRGIRNAVEAYRAAVGALREEGLEPFLFSSMGSHGRGTAEGQRNLLRSLGVTEEKVGAPISCSDQAVRLGETDGPLAASRSTSPGRPPRPTACWW